MKWKLLLVCVATLAGGCLRTVSGPVPAQPTSTRPAPEHLRIVYAGSHYRQPDDFVARLEDRLGRELGRPIAIEVASERQDGHDPGWPPGVRLPENGDVTVLVRAIERFRCGTGPAAVALLSLMTAGLVPYLDGDSVTWRTEIYAGPGAPVDAFDLGVRWAEYGWLPLVPLKPLNMGWRWLHGDVDDEFLRIFPSHLHAHLDADHSPVASRSARRAMRVTTVVTATVATSPIASNEILGCADCDHVHFEMTGA
jgi:hypothetical protein